MKNPILTRAAAALLLLPLGAIVAQPAAAQHRGAVVAQASAIDRFVVRPMGRAQGGEELRFRLDGVPGGRAWVDIPGVASGITLQETRPGLYEGSYTLRRRDARDGRDAAAQAVATLQNGWQRASARADVRGRDDFDRNARRDDDFDRHGRRDADRVAPQAPHLQLTSHGDGSAVTAGHPYVLSGRTLPHALVRVEVDAMLLGGFFAEGMSPREPVLDRTVRADAAGQFAVTVVPVHTRLPSDRDEVRLTASAGGATVTQRLTLLRRAG